MSMNRRQMVAAAAGLLTPSAAVVASPVMSPRERMGFHLAEFRKAAQELDPSIADWSVSQLSGPGSPCAIVVAAYRNR